MVQLDTFAMMLGTDSFVTSPEYALHPRRLPDVASVTDNSPTLFITSR